MLSPPLQSATAAQALPQHINSLRSARLEAITWQSSSFSPELLAEVVSCKAGLCLVRCQPGRERLQPAPAELGCLLPAEQTTTTKAFEEDAGGTQLSREQSHINQP